MKIHLEIESELCGLDTLSGYSTFKEAVAGFKRLVKVASKHAKTDKVPRTIRMVTEIEA